LLQGDIVSICVTTYVPICLCYSVIL